jgi:hypothetical protein
MRTRAALFLVGTAALLSYSLGPIPPLPASQERLALPHRAEVVPGKLYVTVYEHDVKTADRKVPCWSFVSEGLKRHGQHEIVFTLRRPRGKSWEASSGEILALFKGIYDNAEQGNRVEAYGGSILAKATLFLGNQGPWGLIYIPAEMFDGVDVPFEALAAVLIKGDEVEVMIKSSALRIASMLGAEYKYYPCPPWSDPSRKAVVSMRQFGKSILNRVTVNQAPGLRVSHSALGGSSMIFLNVEGSAAARLGSLVAKLPDKGIIALMTDPEPSATMRYAWLPAVGKTGLIFAEQGLYVSGCFALFIYGEEMKEGGGKFEDGISMILSPASWNKLKASLISFQPARITLNDNTLVTTVFVHTVPVDPLKPRSFNPRHIGLFQSQEELKARLGEMSSLNDYIGLIEKAVSAALAAGEQGDARGFLIAVAVKPGKQVMHWYEAVEGSLPEETLSALEAALGNIPPIEVKEGPIAFVLKSGLWDRKVKEFPEFPAVWAAAIAKSGKPFSTLDELLKIIWPDWPSPSVPLR